MSNVSQAHTIVPFVAGETKALTGQRLARVICKQTAKMAKDGIKALPSVAASVPQISSDSVAARVPDLMPYIVQMVESAQDGIIRSLYESSEGALTQVLDSEISLDAVIAFLGAESEGDRLTKKAIELWFDSAAKDACAAIVAEKFGFAGDSAEWSENQQTRVNMGLKAYKDLFSGLSGGRTHYDDKIIRGLILALELMDSDSIGSRLRARLAKMERENQMAREVSDALF